MVVAGLTIALATTVALLSASGGGGKGMMPAAVEAFAPFPPAASGHQHNHGVHRVGGGAAASCASSSPPSSPPSSPRSLTRLVTSAELRQRLRLRGKERRKRLPLSEDSLRDLELLGAALKEAIPLGDLPYIIEVRDREDEQAKVRIENSSQLQLAHEAAEKDGVDLQLFIGVDPAYQDPSPPEWLLDMPDPLESEMWQMTSFYRFFPVDDPDTFAGMLRALWEPLGARGRVYVASEGVNAQMAIPCNVLDRFRMAADSVEGLRGVYLNFDTTWPREHVLQEGAGPFKSLHIRSRHQIVADGLEPGELDCSSNIGKGLTPAEWHSLVDREETIVLDCRNDYESDVGIFETAMPLDTSYFRETWDVLERELEGTPKDTPIMTYCTGGIRCVKVAAFLEQKMGYTNVTRLEGGIISYAKHVKKEGLPSKFRGTNYVFDNRMAEKITDDILSSCEQCGSPWDLHHNCANIHCHTRFLQCPQCGQQYNGCCSRGCRDQRARQDMPATAGLMKPRRWLLPQPFQSSSLNRLFDGVIDEADDSVSTGSASAAASEQEDVGTIIESLCRLGGIKRALSLTEEGSKDSGAAMRMAMAGARVSAVMEQDEASQVGDMLSKAGAEGQLVAHRSSEAATDSGAPFEFIHIQSSAESEDETTAALFNDLIGQRALAKRGLLAISGGGNAHSLYSCLRPVHKGLMEFAVLEVGKDGSGGITFARWKG